MYNLAWEFRPKTLQDFVGQTHLLNDNAPLKIILEKNNNNEQNMLPNLIFFGPTGSGKTSLANIIATISNKKILNFNGTNFKLDILKKALDQYQHTFIKPILLIDEIHRLNTAQQDFLLPIIERGLISFIGASTENPFFTLNAALRSRSFLFEFKPLHSQDLEILYNRVIDKYPPKHDFLHVKEWLLAQNYGDCRVFLNLLDIALEIDSKQTVTIESNKFIYTLLDECEKINGIPVVINTSLNFIIDKCEAEEKIPDSVIIPIETKIGSVQRKNRDPSLKYN